MIAYNKIGLANQRLRDEVRKQLNSGYITGDEFKAIKEKYPAGFYTPGLFARIGLFILTCIVISFADGILSLMFATASDLIETSGWVFFLAILSYIALEVMVNTKHHYRSGVDDALLFVSALLFAVGLAMLFSHYNNVNYLPLSGAIFVLYLYFSVRFADILTSALCCAALLAFIFFWWTKVIPSGFATVSFIMMLVSGSLYLLSSAFFKWEKFIDYQNCLIVVQIIGLISLYTAGNYYIVQTLGDEFNGHAGKAIPFGVFFWSWTMAVPFFYVGFGIRKKNVILLRIGLLLIAGAFVTLRTYYRLLPVDTALTVGGILILGIAYVIIKYLKTPRYGFTYTEPADEHLVDHLKVDSLIIAQTFTKASVAPTNDGTKFGGGDFGGGGSRGSF